MFLDFVIVCFCVGIIFCVIYAIYNVKKLRFFARQQPKRQEKRQMFVYNPPTEDEVDVFASIEE